MDGDSNSNADSNGENEIPHQNEKEKLSKSQNDVQNIHSRPHTSSTYGDNESRARTWGAAQSRILKNKSKNKQKKPFKARQPRIDDCVRTRYPEWKITARNDKDIYNANHRSPGPVYVPKIGYVLPGAPSFSIGGIIEDKSIKKRSPGPIYNPQYHFTHDVSPSYSLLPRREDLTGGTQTPAPNQYDPTKSKWFRSQKKFALKGRIETREDVASSTPGPTDYDVSKSIRKHSLIGCKIGKRLPDMTQKHLKSVPGPAAYMPSTNYVLPRSKKFSIGARTKTADSNDDNPGPGHYGPSIIPPLRKKKKRKNAPSF